MYGEHYADLTSFPITGMSDRYYMDDEKQVKYWWGELYGKYAVRYQNYASVPSTGIIGIIYIADDTNTHYYWDGEMETYKIAEGGSGIAGPGDNTTVSDQDLLVVLGVSTIAEAIEELHIRINNNGGAGEYLGGLKLGMYLDIPSLNDGSISIDNNGAYQNLRIRISEFNKYKNGVNTKNHIVFEFKHIPITKQMRTDNTNDGGYPKDGGTTVYKTYVEGGFLAGLKVALGHDYIYPVKRNVTTGINGGWTKTSFEAAIFPLAEKEVFGTNSYGDATTEADLSQIAFYARGGSKIKNYNGSATRWWEGSPNASDATFFCAVNTDGSANRNAASNACGVAPCFCLS
jgi:hypothetical protein